jgi:hypothetical protein
MVAISRAAIPGLLEEVAAIARPLLARYRPNAPAANAKLLRVYTELMSSEAVWNAIVVNLSVRGGPLFITNAMATLANSKFHPDRDRLLMIGLAVLALNMTICLTVKLRQHNSSDCRDTIEHGLREAREGRSMSLPSDTAAQQRKMRRDLADWFAVDERAPAAPAAAPAAAALAPLPCTYCGKELAPEVAMKCTPKDGKDCPTKAVYCNVDCQRADWKAGHKEVHRAAAVGGARKRRSTQRKRSTRRSTRRH